MLYRADTNESRYRVMKGRSKNQGSLSASNPELYGAMRVPATAPPSHKVVPRMSKSGLSALILVDGGFGTETDPQVRVQGWRRFEEMQKDRRAYTEHFVRGMYFKPHPEEYYRKVVEASLITPTNTAVLMAGNALMRPDYRHILYNVNRPVYYAGRAGNRPQAEILKGLVPWAHVEIFEDCGHALFVDDAERFNRTLGEFLRTAVAAGK